MKNNTRSPISLKSVAPETVANCSLAFSALCPLPFAIGGCNRIKYNNNYLLDR